LIEGKKGSTGEKGPRGEKGQKGMAGTCETQGSSSSSSRPEFCATGCTGFHFFEKVQDQPEELKMSNISPLMEACFSLLPTVMAILVNRKQSP